MVSINYHQHSDCSQCIDQWWGWVKKQSVPPLKGFRDKKILMDLSFLINNKSWLPKFSYTS